MHSAFIVTFTRRQGPYRPAAMERRSRLFARPHHSINTPAALIERWMVMYMTMLLSKICCSCSRPLLARPSRAPFVRFQGSPDATMKRPVTGLQQVYQGWEAYPKGPPSRATCCRSPRWRADDLKDTPRGKARWRTLFRGRPTSAYLGRGKTRGWGNG